MEWSHLMYPHGTCSSRCSFALQEGEMEDGRTSTWRVGSILQVCNVSKIHEGNYVCEGKEMKYRPIPYMVKSFVLRIIFFSQFILVFVKMGVVSASCKC